MDEPVLHGSHVPGEPRETKGLSELLCFQRPHAQPRVVLLNDDRRDPAYVKGLSTIVGGRRRQLNRWLLPPLEVSCWGRRVSSATTRAPRRSHSQRARLSLESHHSPIHSGILGLRRRRTSHGWLAASKRSAISVLFENLQTSRSTTKHTERKIEREKDREQAIDRSSDRRK